MGVQCFLVIEGSNSCICDECKEVLDGKFAGPWNLIQSGSERCDGGCLYSNTSNVEICMCNPGPVRYQACPIKGNCYSDRPRQLPKFAGRSSKMVPAECNKICAKMNYAYFGVQYYNECWCGNNAPNIGKKLEILKCNTMCSGNSSLRCGGGLKNNVWKVCNENEKCKFNY